MKQAACLLVLVCTLLADQAIAANRQQNKLNTTTAQQTLNRADLPEHYSAQFDAALVAYVDQSIDLAELCVRYRLADEARSHLDVVKLLVNRPTMQDALTKINPRLASAEASLAQLDAEIAADASQQKTYLDSSTGRRKLEIVQKQAEQKLVPAFAGAIDKLVIELKESNHPGLVKFIVLDLVSLGIAEDQARRMVGYVHHDTLGWVEAGLLE